jgi:hypothetical protein
MKSKISLYTIIGILIFILVATICPDCAESGSREELEWQKSKKLAEGMSEEEATEAAKKEIEKEEQEDRDYDDLDEGGEYLNGDEDDEEDYAPDEKKPISDNYAPDGKTPIPDKPVTYSGNALGLSVVLIVNFKTKVVSGSVSMSGDGYVDATITNGTIDAFYINAKFSGIMGTKEYGGIEEEFKGTISGPISNDLSTFDGLIIDDEGGGGEFTATRLELID